MLIGEAKWEDDDFDHQQWRRASSLQRAEYLVTRLKTADPARKPKREAPEWQRHLALITRRNVTAAVRSAAKEAGARIITFAKLFGIWIACRNTLIHKLAQVWERRESRFRPVMPVRLGVGCVLRCRFLAFLAGPDAVEGWKASPDIGTARSGAQPGRRERGCS